MVPPRYNDSEYIYFTTVATEISEVKEKGTLNIEHQKIKYVSVNQFKAPSQWRANIRDISFD